MGLPGLVRVCLRDKQRRVSGLARPWRVGALCASLEADPDTVADLLVAAQRFFHGDPFERTSYAGILGVLRRVRLDRGYSEQPASQGLAIFELDARRVRLQVRGASWRRAGWLYYHDGRG
jgi:hypothetical protein